MIAQVKENRMESKRFLQQESSKVVEIEQKKIAQSHQVTRSHTPRTAAVAPHMRWCSSEATRDWISHASTTTSINQLLFFFVCFFLQLFFRGQKNAMSLFLVELVFFKFLLTYPISLDILSWFFTYKNTLWQHKLQAVLLNRKKHIKISTSNLLSILLK